MICLAPCGAPTMHCVPVTSGPFPASFCAFLMVTSVTAVSIWKYTSIQCPCSPYILRLMSNSKYRNGSLRTWLLLVATHPFLVRRDHFQDEHRDARNTRRLRFWLVHPRIVCYLDDASPTRTQRFQPPWISRSVTRNAYLVYLSKTPKYNPCEPSVKRFGVSMIRFQNKEIFSKRIIKYKQFRGEIISS